MNAWISAGPRRFEPHSAALTLRNAIVFNRRRTHVGVEAIIGGMQTWLRTCRQLLSAPRYARLSARSGTRQFSNMTVSTAKGALSLFVLPLIMSIAVFSLSASRAGAAA